MNEKKKYIKYYLQRFSFIDHKNAIKCLIN